MQKPRGVSRRARWAGYIGIVGAVVVCAVSWPMGRAAAQNACVGDCGGNDDVTVDELILSVNIALGTEPLTACDAIDANADDHATIDELVGAVNASLEGCPIATPLATATLTLLPATVTPLPTGTASATVTELPATVTPLPTGTASATVTELPATVTPLPTGTVSATVTDTPAPVATDTVAPSATATETPSPSATSTPTPTQTPGPAPSGLTAVIDGSEIHLTWVNSAPIFGHTAVRLVRRLNAAPEGPDDPEAVGVFAGTAASAVDDLTALLPDVPEAAPGTTAMPRTYYYTVYGCTPEGACETDGSSTALKPTLVQVLRGGGYTIYWRHAQASQCSDASLGSAATTQCPDWWKRCESMCQDGAPICPLAGSPLATARQLVNTGRDQATAIGQAFDLRGIPIGRVVSSEYCRTVQTAQLMDFGPVIETNQGITFSVYDEAKRCEHALDLLSEVPAPGSNTAVIGHMITVGPCPPLDDGSVGSTFQMSEAAVFKPDGEGGGQFVDRVLWYEWAELP